MSNYNVSKTFKFDAAHRLIDGYVGKCNSLHGHTWKAVVTLCSTDTELDKFGMLYDFNDFKPLREWVDNRLDHATILNISDPLVDTLASLPSSTPMCRVYAMMDNPTSENLAREIFHQATQLLDLSLTNAYVECVEVWESETSKAVYYG